eukprot:scaffold14898_cov1283-Alexandrium_tamarense.AAC.7
MELKVVYDQWEFYLHHPHVDDHMGSLLNLEQLDVYLTNVYDPLYHFESERHHCYSLHQLLQNILYGLI